MPEIEVQDTDIHVGFTGTQVGMTEPQKSTVTNLLAGFAPGFFHHGWCIGADAEADEIARSLGYKIIGHPPIKTVKMADLPEPDIMCDPKDYMARNLDIARAVSVMVATPKRFKEEQFSGTWATVRRARKSRNVMFLLIVWPDGSWTVD